MATQTVEKSINIPISTIQKQGGVVVLSLREYKKLCEGNEFYLEDKLLLEKAKNDLKKGRVSSRKKIMRFLNS